MFRDRTAAIQKAMQEAQKASEEARRKLAEIESRLQKLDVEIGMMRDAAEKEGVAEEARIQAAAEEDARKIVASAEQEISAAAKAARRQLTATPPIWQLAWRKNKFTWMPRPIRRWCAILRVNWAAPKDSGKDRN